MEHQAEVIHTRNENPAVPDALHARCSCGWSSSARDEQHARQLVADHVADPGVPPPFAPSPD